jgi:environmental stress-induced protein Ves
MKIFRFTDLIATPWKNGGGVTRELLRNEADGNVVWRLSIADVASEGPFSAFPGMRRNLTVIEGEGMQLVCPDRSFLAADLLSPVAFSGDEPINGLLPQGPCRDFNVIWNPSLVEAAVTLIGPENEVPIEGSVHSGILCVTSTATLSSGEKLAFGDFACVNEPMTLTNGKALAIVIRAPSHP